MSTIEELTEERDRLYQEHSDAFQAWMDAEVVLRDAIEEEAALERHAARARRYTFFAGIGIAGAVILISLLAG